MEMTALVADRAAKFLCSARELLSVGSRSDLRPTESVLHHKRDGRVLLQRCGKRDSLDFRVARKTREINASMISTTKNEVESLPSGPRALRTGHGWGGMP